jgi:hypothetical protein
LIPALVEAPLGFVSAPRATGSKGIALAPNSNDPMLAITLRRDVRRASARAEFSANASIHFIGHSSGCEQLD